MCDALVISCQTVVVCELTNQLYTDSNSVNCIHQFSSRKTSQTLRFKAASFFTRHNENISLQ